MKRTLLLISIIIQFYILYSQQYALYESEIMKVFNSGEMNNQLGLDYPGYEIGVNGPSAMGFTETGEVYIMDHINDRLQKYSNTYIWKSSTAIENRPVMAIIIADKNGCQVITSLEYKYVNNTGDLEIDVLFGMEKRQSIIEYIRIDNILFVYIDNSFFAINEPGIDPANNNLRMLDATQIRVLFDNPLAYGLDGVTLDSKNRLIVNGELVTRSYEAFVTYYMEKRSFTDVLQFTRQVENKYRALNYKGGGNYFAGKDETGNWYWFNSGYLSIFSDKGFQIDLINLVNNSRQTTPAIHPSGDVYFLDYDKNNVFVKRIQNVWDPEGRATWYAAHPEGNTTAKQYARITSTNVRIREQPTLQGKQLGYVQTNDTVEILERSTEMMRIDTMNNYWYKIRKADGMEGWVYGEFVELKN